jgi:F0F1-type ATP synthase alpha subunit
MDDVPVERIKEFQAQWADFLVTRKAEVLQKIGKEKVVSDAIKADLTAAADQFKQAWSARPSA